MIVFGEKFLHNREAGAAKKNWISSIPSRLKTPQSPQDRLNTVGMVAHVYNSRIWGEQEGKLRHKDQECQVSLVSYLKKKKVLFRFWGRVLWCPGTGYGDKTGLEIASPRIKVVLYHTQQRWKTFVLWRIVWIWKWWCMPKTPAFGEAEARRLLVRGYPGLHNELLS